MTLNKEFQRPAGLPRLGDGIASVRVLAGLAAALVELQPDREA